MRLGLAMRHLDRARAGMPLAGLPTLSQGVVVGCCPENLESDA